MITDKVLKSLKTKSIKQVASDIGVTLNALAKELDYEDISVAAIKQKYAKELLAKLSSYNELTAKDMAYETGFSLKKVYNFINMYDEIYVLNKRKLK